MSKFSHLSSHVNPRILAGAVSVAVFLWLYVKLGETYQYRMTIPVQISRIHPDRALSAELPENITVRMQGLGSSLAGMRLLWGRNLAFALDLSQVTGEWACVPNDHKEWITFPPGFEDMLVSQIIGPDTIHVQVEPALEKRLPVVGRHIAITPEAGYIQVGPILFQPDTVTVRGPRSLMRSIYAMDTDSLMFEGGQDLFTEIVDLANLSSSLIQVQETQVTMAADIQKLGERTLGNIPVTVTGAPSGRQVRIEPETVDLVIHGGVNFIHALDPSQIRAFIPFQYDWQRYKEYRVGLEIESPDDIITVNATPRILTVIVP